MDVSTSAASESLGGGSWAQRSRTVLGNESTVDLPLSRMGASYERLRRRDSYREQGGGHVPEEVEDSSASRGAENLPNSDGVQFALGALVYDMYLFKRVYSTVPPSPFEVMVLALGVAVSLAGLAWWNTPGTTYLPNRNRLMLFFRAYHLLTCGAVPCSAVYATNTTPWRDFANVLISPGFSCTMLVMQAVVPLPLLPSLLIDVVVIPFVVAEAFFCCQLRFMEPLRSQVSASLRVLLRIALLRPLRGKLGRLTTRGECHVVLGTSYFLGALAVPTCIGVEGWTRRMQSTARRGREGGPRPVIVLSIPTPTFRRLVSWWLRQPFAVRLLVYLMALQLAVVLAVGVSSLVVE